MSINKQGLKAAQATEEEFLKWCRKYKKPNYKTDSKKEFIDKILSGKLIKDEKTKEWIEK